MVCPRSETGHRPRSAGHTNPWQLRPATASGAAPNSRAAAMFAQTIV